MGGSENGSELEQKETLRMNSLHRCSIQKPVTRQSHTSEPERWGQYPSAGLIQIRLVVALGGRSWGGIFHHFASTHNAYRKL
jgi:hypothetical protein